MTTAQLATVPLPADLRSGHQLPPRRLAGPTHSGGRQTALPADAGQARTILGDPGGCPPDGTTVAIVLDQSPSITSSDGNDPLSRRHAEAALAIRHVAAACRCGRDRIALVPFDCDSPGHVAPQPLTALGVRRLDRTLRRLASVWGLSSQLGPALDRAESHTTRHGAGSAAVVVFSDFLLTDPSPTTALRRLRGFPGHVHAVVLGASPPSVLTDDPNVTVTRLTPTSPPGAAARAVFDGLTRYRTHHRTDPGSAAPATETPDDEGELIA